MENRENLKESTVDGIQELIKVNMDSYQGLRKASELIDNQNVRSMFESFANEREANTKELQSIVQNTNTDEEPNESGSILGQMHRWWMDVKSNMTSEDLKSVLKSAENGEDKIKAKYEEVIKETTGSPVNDILHQQYAKVKKQHDQIRDCRDKHLNEEAVH